MMNIMQCIYNETSNRVYGQKQESADYTALVQKYSDTLRKLEAVFTDEQRHIFYEAEAQRNLIGAEDEEWMFQWGVRLGAKFMTEILLGIE